MEQTSRKISGREVSTRLPTELERLAADLTSFQDRAGDLLSVQPSASLLVLLQRLDEMSQRAQALAAISRQALSTDADSRDLSVVLAACGLSDLESRLRGAAEGVEHNKEDEIW